jgi:tetratricopeptide (TPR) repeat protein
MQYRVRITSNHLGLCGWLLLSGVLLWSTPVEARPASGKVIAKVHFNKGMAAFELGKFQEALEEYEKAYGLLPLPGFLFNIGQCYRNLDQPEKAVFFFRLYLRKKPQANNRKAVELLLVDLEAKQESQRLAEKREEEKKGKAQHAPEPSSVPQKIPAYVLPVEKISLLKGPPPPAQTSQRPVYKTWWFWTSVTALALGGGAVGVYFATRSNEPALPNSPFPVLDFSRK